MLKYAENEHPTDLFFIEVLAVPPPKARPCQVTANVLTVHPLSHTLELVVENVTVLKQALQVGKKIAPLTMCQNVRLTTLNGSCITKFFENIARTLN